MGAPSKTIVMIFSTGRDFADVVNAANLYTARLKDFGLAKGQIWGHPQEIAMGLSPLPLCVAFPSFARDAYRVVR